MEMVNNISAWSTQSSLEICIPEFQCPNSFVWNTLIREEVFGLYKMDIARQLFERMNKHDVHSWNSMILGFAMHGMDEAALKCFDYLAQEEGLVPKLSHLRGYWLLVIIRPVLEHYGSLVDLLGRAGPVDEALDIIANMPMEPDVVIWRSILDACSKKNGGLELSEEVARQKEPDKGVKKEPGCSSIEIYGISHEFFAGDTSHSCITQIYKLLDVIDKRLEAIGNVPDVSQGPMVYEGELVDGKRHLLRLHSERHAIAYGLFNLPPGDPIHVFKNLRVCNHYHNVTKLKYLFVLSRSI
ncbi:pentatricopeptide repeat-containing protein At1g59720, chloroplastic/mitochondrial-like [Apium graveolens]|uniref:pentatricopeptide repeat-containing protein At1g59720, chloroplastic/mitochondrial-like n=1 Tax=Apium graveolens TaxID=4045 RepID=UPI003D7BDB98